jgi:hypothetical protein
MTRGRRAVRFRQSLPRVLGIAAGLGWLRCGAALAQAPAAQDQAAPSAAELRARGEAAAAAGKHQECIRAYSAAFALEADAGTAGELGLCEEALGRDLEAYDHLAFALEREVPAAPAAVQARWSQYRVATKKLLQRIALVMVSVFPSRAEVLLDGRSLGANVSGRVFAVLPGKHTWTARLPGREDIVVPHVVRGGDVPDVLLALPPETPPREAKAPPAGEPGCKACRPPPAYVEPCPIAGGLVIAVDLCNALRAVLRNMDPTFGVVVGGALSLGFTADVGPGFFVGGEAYWRRKEEWGFHLALESRFFFPTKGGINSTGEQLDVTFLDFALVPCARYKWVLGCAFIDAGVVFGSGVALSGPEVEDRGLRPLFMLGMGPRLAADIPLVEHVGIRAFADLRFSPLPVTGYRENGVIITWQHPPVSGFLGVGLAFR